MNRAISLAYWENLGTSELNIIKIVEFLGGTVRLVRLTTEVARHPDSDKAFLTKSNCLITSAQALANLRKEIHGTMELLTCLADPGAKVFIYGFEPVSGHDSLLRELTAGALVAVEPSPAANRRIDVASDHICRQLSGLSFEVPGTDEQYAFVQGSARASFTPVMSIEQKPLCVHIKSERCETVLTTSGRIADLDAVADPGASVLDAFTGLAPLLIFLYGSLREYLWHNDSPTACFIVDDPLLKRRYGCLNYKKLLALMDRKRFSASIAFIPWNCKRSQRQVVESFAGRPMSLCVHGCDHTGREFGGNDSVMLRQKARQALERMKLHRSLSGLDFDDVMVFPQGIFSTTAMSALKSCGYLAAVNSTVFPVDAGHTLTLRDLLQPAVTRYSNLPLFTRWYPHQFSELAFNLFLGKPSLIVEHHGYFSQGYDALAETIEKVHRLDSRLQWSNPATICSRACWKRVAEDGDVHILFFTDRFELRNETSSPQKYVLIRHGLSEPDTAVTINGRRVNVRQDGVGLRVQLLLGGGEAAEIRVEGGQPEVVVPHPAPRPMYQVGVFIRRCLSEFRDNYWDMNPFVSRNRQG